MLLAAEPVKTTLRRVQTRRAVLTEPAASRNPIFLIRGNGISWANPSVLSQSISVNGRPFSIVGVAPRGFDGVVRGQTADIWITAAQYFPLRNRPDALDRRTTSWLTLIGRLNDGVTAARGEDELTSMARQLPQAEPGDWSVRLIPAAGGDAGLVEDLSTPLRLLMATVGLILLIAAANVANLLLARAYARQPEIALRQALGATRRRIVQHALVEISVLALAGGAAGLLLASWVLELFEIRTAGGTLLSLNLNPSLPIIAFAAALSLGAAIAAGILPAVTTSRPELVNVMNGGYPPGRLFGKRRLRTMFASSLNCWYMLGRRRLMSSELRRDGMSR